MGLTRKTCIFCSFVIFFLELSSAREETRTYRNVDQDGSTEPYFPSNRSLEDIYVLTSSKTVLAKHVFRGLMMSYNEGIIPRAIIATFTLKIFYKNRFGRVSGRKRLISVIDRTYQDTYHCFKHMSRNRDYIVYLNGTALRAGSGGVTQDYYWVSSKPQPATRGRVKKVVAFSCSDCPSKPTLKFSHFIETTDEANSLHLTCLSTSECKLPVNTYWFKDRKLIHEGDNNEIDRGRTSRGDEGTNGDLTTPSSREIYEKYKIYKDYRYSVLIVNDLNDNDDGTYRCLMMNVVGEKSQDFLWPVPVTTATTPTTTHLVISTENDLSGFDPCPDNYNCLHNGDCLIARVTGETICRCYEGYYGNHCQFTIHGMESRTREGKKASQTVYIFLALLTFILFLLLLATFFLFRSFEKLKKQLLSKGGDMRLEPINSDSFGPKDLIFETEEVISTHPEAATAAPPNQYVDSEDMISSRHPMMASDKPSSGRSMRKAFTHYFFGPASTPPFKVKSPTFNGRCVEKASLKDSKPPKGHALPPLTPKSSSSPSQLCKPPGEPGNKTDLELHHHTNSDPAKSHVK